MEQLLDRLSAALAGRYRIDREIGRGGMAVVFLAHDERHGRQVALKVLRPDLTWSIGTDRFLQEIRISAGLTHPHILPLFDSGEIAAEPGAAAGTSSGPLLYYAMPYVASESLRHRLQREQQLPVGEAVAIARQVAAALAHAHTRGVVHRDIKPENILLEDGEAVVADFGIARAVEVAAEDRLSDPGVVIGTPAYMSPEQASGGEVDGRSDVYSLGCVLYEMLTGEPPFHGSTPRAVLARHVSDTPPPMRVVRDTLDPGLEQIVYTALAKVPADRFATAADMARALATESSGATSLVRPRAGAWRWRVRGVLLAAAVVVTAVAGIAWFLGTAGATELDPRRVLVLPLEGTAAATGPEFLADATIALQAALNSTPALRGIHLEDGADDVGGAARRLGAGYAISSRLLAGDSLRLVLTLHDVRGDSAIQRVASLGPGATAWQLGVRAAARVLPVLIPSGGGWDLTALEARSTQASAEFLLGERAYRNAQFGEAFERFRSALELDSAFTLAAIRGALAALWTDDPREARPLAQRALADTALSPWHAAMAAGLVAYAEGRADSAVAAFRRATTANEQRPEGWMALGEVYTHLLPSDASPDSAARSAFQRALHEDFEFVPAIPHLIEAAVRGGDTAGAAALLAQFAAAQPDSSELRIENLIVRCARNPGTGVDWRAAVRERPADANAAAYLLSVGGLGQPVCAESAWRAMLEHDTTAGQPYRLGALLGLHGVLVATARPGEAMELAAADTILPIGLRRELLLLHWDGVEEEAPELREALRAAAESYRGGEAAHSINLWFLGIGHDAAGDLASLRDVTATLSSRAAVEGGTRLDSLLAGSLRARSLVMAGDTSGAVTALQRLEPTGEKADVAWLPWEALAAERMALAQLLHATGAHARSIRVASTIDAPAAVGNIMYVPESLRLRERAARELGLSEEARRYRERLDALGHPAGPRRD